MTPEKTKIEFKYWSWGWELDFYFFFVPLHLNNACHIKCLSIYFSSFEQFHVFSCFITFVVARFLSILSVLSEKTVLFEFVPIFFFFRYISSVFLIRAFLFF